MTSTLRANRRTTASRLAMLLSAATSCCLVCTAHSFAQEPVRPPSPLASETQGQTTPGVQPPVTQGERNLVATEDEGKYTPPSRGELYRVDSESTLAERMRQIRKSMGKTPLDFPEEDGIRIKTSLEKRQFAQMTTISAAPYVVYQPLYFQQINVERYGWEFGIFQPVVSTAQFYGDVLLFPYKFAANPPWTCDANVGYGLPGDPEPLRFLTPPFSWRGVIGEVGAAVGGAAIFP